jgi:hypothetical protein
MVPRERPQSLRPEQHFRWQTAHSMISAFCPPLSTPSMTCIPPGSRPGTHPLTPPHGMRSFLSINYSATQIILREYNPLHTQLQ